MPMIFEERMGVMWDDDADRMWYGVVTQSTNNVVEVLPVWPLGPDVHCYDEGRDYKKDRHNVRLDSAPPPFSLFCISKCVDKCYVRAVSNEFLSFQNDELDMLSIIDGGDKISEEDLDTIFHHPWPEQPGLELGRPAVTPEAPKPDSPSTPASPLLSPKMAALRARLEKRDADRNMEQDGPEF